MAEGVGEDKKFYRATTKLDLRVYKGEKQGRNGSTGSES